MAVAVRASGVHSCPMDVDFLIIGGGIAGATAGAHLAPLGAVALVEAEDALAHHASGRSAALFEKNYGHRVTVALNEASAGAHATTEGGWLSPRGLMLLAGAEEAYGFARDAAKMGLEEIPLDAAEALLPILNRAHVRHAAHHDAAWDIDTHRMIETYARPIRKSGGVHTGARVTRISREAEGWRVTAGTRDWHARVIVNAAGAWADPIARTAGLAPLGLTPLRRSMARMPSPGGHDPRGWPMIFGVDEAWYAKPDAGAWIVSPAEEDPVEPHDAWADDMVLAEGIARYQPFVTEEVTRVTATWAGLRTFAPDRALVIGRDPACADFLWCAGQGGYGFQTAPAAGRLLADLVAGRAPDLPAEIVAALDPGRFG